MSETPTDQTTPEAPVQPEAPSAPESATEAPTSEPEQPAVPEAIQASIDDVQAKFDSAEEKGHFGERVDPTPLEHYTVAGVIAGKPTPETDADASLAAVQATHTAPNVSAQPAASAEAPSEAAQADVNPPAEQV